MDVFDVELRKAPSQANIQLRLAEKEPHLGAGDTIHGLEFDHLMDDNGEKWEDEVLPPDQDLGEEWDVTEMDNPFEVPSSQGVNPEVEAEYSSLSLPSTIRVDRCHQAGLQVLLQ
ncbi:hypothetical protein AcW1_003397 [Taiwanofungus camphoratus]|nr:hypothetical protein AcW1_003397 [Antrodia cinnamomea]